MTLGVEQGGGLDHPESGARRRSFAALMVLAVCAALLFTGLVALGTWQIQRLHLKRTLIERVNERAHAAPVPVPARERWAGITAETDEYLRVKVTGTFLPEHSALVQASTVLGSGYWLITPLQDEQGNIVLVNRGFLSTSAATHMRQALRSGQQPANGRQPAADDRTKVTVTGLLRISEPGGGFLRKNDPQQDKWYSRDVAAIAAARDLTGVAPYFIDADATSAEQVKSASGSSDGPVGGLTVITFPNNHLVYALTWYALALMVAGASLWVAREEYRDRRGLRSHVSLAKNGSGQNSADARDD